MEYPVALHELNFAPHTSCREAPAVDVRDSQAADAA